MSIRSFPEPEIVLERTSGCCSRQDESTDEYAHFYFSDHRHCIGDFPAVVSRSGHHAGLHCTIFVFQTFHSYLKNYFNEFHGSDQSNALKRSS